MRYRIMCTARVLRFIVIPLVVALYCSSAIAQIAPEQTSSGSDKITRSTALQEQGHGQTEKVLQDRATLSEAVINLGPRNPSDRREVAATSLRELISRADVTGDIQADAAFELGLAYLDGKGLPRNVPMAGTLFLLAAQHNHAGAINKLVEIYYHGWFTDRNPEEAFRNIKILEERGDPEGLYSLGLLYEEGFGVPPDKTKAESYYRKSAELFSNRLEKHRTARDLVFLGAQFFYGEGVPQDFSQSRALFEEALALGEASAGTFLGAMYSNGNGVPEDHRKAEALFWEGYRNGDHEAILGLLAVEISKPDGTRNDQLTAQLALEGYVYDVGGVDNILIDGRGEKLSVNTRLWIQYILYRDGFLHGDIDGIFGDQTLAALRNYRFVGQGVPKWMVLREIGALEPYEPIVLKPRAAGVAAHDPNVPPYLDSSANATIDWSLVRNVDPDAYESGIHFDDSLPLELRRLILEDLQWLNELGPLADSSTMSRLLGMGGESIDGKDLSDWIVLHAGVIAGNNCENIRNVVIRQSGDRYGEVFFDGEGVGSRCAFLGDQTWLGAAHSIVHNIGNGDTQGTITHWRSASYADSETDALISGDTLIAAWPGREIGPPVFWLNEDFILKKHKANEARIYRIGIYIHEITHSLFVARHHACRLMAYDSIAAIYDKSVAVCDLGVSAYLAGLAAQFVLTPLCQDCPESEISDIEREELIAPELYAIRRGLLGRGEPFSSINNDGLLAFGVASDPHTREYYASLARVTDLVGENWTSAYHTITPWSERRIYWETAILQELERLGKLPDWGLFDVSPPQIRTEGLPDSEPWLRAALEAEDQGYNVPLRWAPSCSQFSGGCPWISGVKTTEAGAISDTPLPDAAGQGANLEQLLIDARLASRVEGPSAATSLFEAAIGAAESMGDAERLVAARIGAAQALLDEVRVGGDIAKLASAARHAEAAAELGMREPEVALLLGDIRAVEGQWANAVQQYTRALTVDPLLAEAYRGRAEAHRATGNEVAATRDETAQAAIISDPTRIRVITDEVLATAVDIPCLDWPTMFEGNFTGETKICRADVATNDLRMHILPGAKGLPATTFKCELSAELRVDTSNHVTQCFVKTAVFTHWAEPMKPVRCSGKAKFIAGQYDGCY